MIVVTTGKPAEEYQYNGAGEYDFTEKKESYCNVRSLGSGIYLRMMRKAASR